MAPECLIRSLAKKKHKFSLELALMWPKNGNEKEEQK